jgi:hypothetical protein
MSSRPIPPCTECGEIGTRVFIKSSGGSRSLRFSFGFLNEIDLAALICTECGYTELRPHPDDMVFIRAAARKQRRRRG